MKRFLGVTLAVFMCLLTAPVLSAQEYQQYRIRDASGIVFEASTPLFSFQGRSDRIEGRIVFGKDPLRVKPGLTLSVPVKSLKTGLSRRDQDLYQLLEADSYPRITFRPDTVTETTMDPDEALGKEPGDETEPLPGTPIPSKHDGLADTTIRGDTTTSERRRTVMVDGAFTIRGETRQRRVPVVVSLGSDTATIRSRFTLDLRNFDIQPPSLYVMSVNPTVHVRVKLQGDRAGSDTP